MLTQVAHFGLTGKASEAVPITCCDCRISVNREQHVGAVVLVNLAMAYAELGQFDDAWRSIGEAMKAVETTGERWFEAEVHRTAGEIALIAASRTRRKRKPISTARFQ